MEFEVEFYKTVNGHSPVREFLLELKASDPDDFAAVAAGLAKLRNRQCHREPLTKALNDGLFELRHVGNLKAVSTTSAASTTKDRIKMTI
jgi:hypothetical protein